VVALHADRRAQMRGVVKALTDTELEQIRPRQRPRGAWSRTRSATASAWVMREHCEHRRYAMRDLALLEAR
jgi:hypothetical protein